MANNQGTQKKTDQQNRTEGSPTDPNKIDKVGETNIYPVSAMEGASEDAVVHPEASYGQGERGAEGYKDAGTSEVIRDEDVGGGRNDR